MFLFLVLLFHFSANAKDTSSFPYEGKKTDFAVGILGGTGCSRHWDWMDFADYSHLQPADRCAQYVLVSPRHHKWVDMAVYGAEKSWWKVMPIHGDGILTPAKCDVPTPTPIYVLKQYLLCGGEAMPLAFCDEAGKDMGDTLRKHCE
jgi:hypothetical protein